MFTNLDILGASHCIENGHRNSDFSPSKWWFSISFFVCLPGRVLCKRREITKGKPWKIWAQTGMLWIYTQIRPGESGHPMGAWAPRSSQRLLTTRHLDQTGLLTQHEVHQSHQEPRQQAGNHGASLGVRGARTDFGRDKRVVFFQNGCDKNAMFSMKWPCFWWWSSWFWWFFSVHSQ